VGIRNTSALIILAAILAYGVFQYGGVLRADWSVCLLALGLLAVFYWLPIRRAESAPPLQRRLRWLLLLLPGYVAFQLLPLPERLLGLLSPNRAALLAGTYAILPGLGWAPLTVAPAATLMHLFRVAGFTVVCLLVREMAWYWYGRPWIPALPVIVIGVLESGLGLAQYTMGGPGSFAQGTYVNKNHFAGFLEMALPFAVMISVGAWRGLDSRHRLTLGRGVMAVAATATAALIFVAIIYSLSRTGFVASLCSLFLMGALIVHTGLRAWARRLAATSLAVLVALVFLFVPPDRLVTRFADLLASDNITANDRLALWQESTRLIVAYPLFGCGFGGYQSAFLKYKVSAPMLTDDYAHNDYLQLVAELGVIGFLLASAPLAAIWQRAFRTATHRLEPGRRDLAVACTGAIAAILIHGLADFNLYIPANAMLLAWISGLSLGPAHSASQPQLRKPPGVPQILEVRPQP